MAIPRSVKIKNKSLPLKPGVYLMKNKKREIIYIGKATSLKNRVSSYFQKAHDSRIAKMVSEIKSINYEVTDSVLEALILEASLIKKYQPKYNIKEKDDRSWVYLTISKDSYPQLKIIRGQELKKEDPNQFQSIFGPYQSKKILLAILDIIRKIIPLSFCRPNQGHPCFDYQLRLCPGVCLGAISPTAYRHHIKHLKLFFTGRKKQLLRSLNKNMATASQRQDFETASLLRDQIKHLKRINDISLLKKDYFHPKLSSPFYRIEGYDISNISGTNAVGSLVVLTDSQIDKSQYRKFKIKTVHKISDTDMIKEVVSRRFRHSWPIPNLILIDGGQGQVKAVTTILNQFNLKIPVIGLAKGQKRKNNQLIFNRESLKQKSSITKIKPLLIKLRDEAHRFAITYHRSLRKFLQ